MKKNKIRNGFSMIELIIVILIVSVLALIASPYFGQTNVFKTRATVDQGEFLMKEGRRIAIGQRRNVYVVNGGSNVFLCYVSANPCPSGQQVSNQGATLSFNTNGISVSVPAGLVFNSQGGIGGVTATILIGGNTFYVDGLTGYVYE